MKKLYLINTKKYPYHKGLIEDFLAVIDGEVIDMGSISNYGDAYHSIEEFSPNVMIILDLAGHDFRTGSDTLSLNGMYCRMANIVFQKAEVYGADMKCRQNLSSFMYISPKDDLVKVRESCIEVYNIDHFPLVFYKAGSVSEHEENQGKIKLWWEQYKKEAMLNEDTDI